MARGPLNTGRMNLYLNLRHVRLSDALRRALVQRIARLEEIAEGILSARVTVAAHDRRNAAGKYRVNVQLAVSGPDIHASHEAGSLWASIDGIGHKLACQLRERRNRLHKNRHYVPEPEGQS